MSRMTAAEKAHMRKYGTMPPHEATPLEQMMYTMCVEYRLLRFYREDQPNLHAVCRRMIRAYAVALVWKKHPDEVITQAEVKALEQDFMRRATQDPPF